MAKLDITTQNTGLTKFIAGLDNLFHRRIMENYRRHAILEITGHKDLIFAADMTVETPVYFVNAEGMSLTLTGHDQVLGFYGTIYDRGASVIVVADEKLAVSDWGFASEGIFHSYMTGANVSPALGGPTDPEKFFIAKHTIVNFWHYDETGRMMGEHVYEHAADRQLIEIPEHEFITLQEARDKLHPLLHPVEPLITAAIAI